MEEQEEDKKEVKQLYKLLIENIAIQQAANQDYMGFYNSEINIRSRYTNPPFTKLIKLVYSARDEKRFIRSKQYYENFKKCNGIIW